MNISVFGLGKVGSAMVAVFASKGFKVWGFDVNHQTVAKLRSGAPVVPEPGVSELLRKYKDNISFTDSISEAVSNTNVSFVIVPTPSNDQGFFETLYVEEAIRQIISSNSSGKNHVIVVSSTIMPGAMNLISSRFFRETKSDYKSSNYQFVYSPEFIALGNVVDNLLEPQFCLVGSDSRLSRSEKWGARLVTKIKTEMTNNSRPVHSVSFESAEIAKISCNTFLTTKIAYANLISQLIQKIPGAKSDEVFNVLHSDDRIGPKFFYPGLGYGGPCLPRDNQALGGLLERLSILSDIPYATHELNNSIVEAIMNSKILKNLSAGDSVLILGLAYKIGTSSMVESQALKIAQRLNQKGVKVRAHDFQVDFSSAELDFLDYGSNDLDMSLYGNSKVVFVTHRDTRYSEFLTSHMIPELNYLDPWGVTRDSSRSHLI